MFFARGQVAVVLFTHINLVLRQGPTDATVEYA